MQRISNTLTRAASRSARGGASPCFVFALLLALLTIAGCNPPRSSTSAAGTPERGHGGRGVLVIVVDSLRADRMGFAGYSRRATPVLDGLARQGVAFTQAFSSAPEIIPSHVALLTGCDPVIARQPLPEDSSAPSIGQRWRIPAPAPALAAEFLADGYATLALSDHAWIAHEYGFGRGFERFDNFQGGRIVDESDFGAAQLGRALVDWIRSLEHDRDWFAYVHINDLERGLRHAEEEWDTFFRPLPERNEIPPVSEAQRAFFAIPNRVWPGGHRTVGEYEACYDGYIRRLDAKLGRLVGVLDRIGRLEHTTICIVGSYGVGFGEAGLYLDHGTLADVDLAIPWIIKYPASCKLPRGQMYDGLASSIDFSPTLLELSGLKIPEGTHGKSHLTALRSPQSPPVNEYVYSMGGLSEGMAVHSRHLSYQSTLHAVRGNSDLVASWYGESKSTNRMRRRFLRNRVTNSDPGDLGPPDPEPEAAELMGIAGEAWYAWMDHARLALHDPPWMKGAVSPEIRAELVQRGLVPSKAQH